MPDFVRSYDVSRLTTDELERARRELAASLALAQPGSPACVPITAQISAIDTELARRYRAGRETSTPHQPGAQYSPAAHAEEGQDHMTNLPTPRAAARISAFLDGHPCVSDLVIW